MSTMSTIVTQTCMTVAAYGKTHIEYEVVEENDTDFNYSQSYISSIMNSYISPVDNEMVSNNVSVSKNVITSSKKDNTFNTRPNKKNGRVNRRVHRIHQPGRTNCTQRYQGK